MKAAFLDFDTLGPDDINVDELRAELPGIELYSHTPKDKVVERIKYAEIVIVNKAVLDADVLLRADNIKLICVAATGSDNIDLSAAKIRGITVCNIRNYCTSSVVQQVFSFILELTQRTGAWQDLIGQGAWQQSKQFCMLDFKSRELQGKTFGIVGLGTLGQAVANVATAFGMRVIAAELPDRKYAKSKIPRVEWDNFLRQTDVISLHCPLNATTANLIDTAALKKMRDNAILINTSRGGLIDEKALMKSLKQNKLGGAGIDVLPVEPPVDGGPLLNTSLPNLLITPHIAWAAIESRQRALDHIISNIRAFKMGNPENTLF
ncbi:MAG: D-2-hydroxyacid dehydrogenase [Gammaproteobacteria bacterium]|nr:D-2-hydroxyacid dehydrogenase [Gammaproteobacteria bacterium]